jgi:predicted metalloprotease with PDZ domain
VRVHSAWALLLQFAILCGCAFAQAPIRHSILLESPERHLVRVTMDIPSGRDTHELQLPVWNALYQVRDFSQYMNWILADDPTGHPLHITKLNKSRWRIEGSQAGARVEYEMFADNPDPYGAQLNSHHAFFNLAEILLYADDERSDPVQVQLRNLPAQWKIATTLESVQGTYLANSYDELVDSPIEIGTFTEADFNGDCGTYRITVDSTDGEALLRKINSPIQRIVATAANWMDSCPFHNYLFIYHVSDSSGGGMEHAYSTAITLPAKNLTDDLDGFTSVTAHEFFHLWNVKRIRPQSLEPVDYTKENYTTTLWFSEGVDSTAAEYILLRSSLLDERHYLDHLSQEITELQNRPAHLRQSVEQSSLDAWLERYPYYGLPERSISYYNKGELLGVMLDLAMRGASSDQASLRDLFRWMNEHYAKQGKFFADSAAVEQAAETLSHTDLRDFFQKYVSGVDEIPWDTVFAPVGLHVTKAEIASPETGFEAVQKFDQPPMVVQVAARSEAARAGLKTQDEILQINEKPAGRNFEIQMENLGPGAELRLVIRRDGAERQLHWKLGSRHETIFQLRDVSGITAQQKARRAAWLFDQTTNKQ